MVLRVPERVLLRRDQPEYHQWLCQLDELLRNGTHAKMQRRVVAFAKAMSLGYGSPDVDRGSLKLGVNMTQNETFQFSWALDERNGAEAAASLRQHLRTVAVRNSSFRTSRAFETHLLRQLRRKAKLLAQLPTHAPREEKGRR